VADALMTPAVGVLAAVLARHQTYPAVSTDTDSARDCVPGISERMDSLGDTSGPAVGEVVGARVRGRGAFQGESEGKRDMGFVSGGRFTSCGESRGRDWRSCTRVRVSHARVLE
jgi:hypothetical protein